MSLAPAVVVSVRSRLDQLRMSASCRGVLHLRIDVGRVPRATALRRVRDRFRRSMWRVAVASGSDVAASGDRNTMRHQRDSVPTSCVPSSMDHPEATGGAPDAQAERAKAIDELYRAHAPAMFRVAVALVRDRGLAEDVVQESIVKAWHHLDSFRGEGSQLAWLLRIAHNTAISHLRRLHDTPRDPLALPESPAEHVESDAIDSMFLVAFENALFDLDALSRAVVVLRELEGLPYELIAQALDIPLPTVKTRLFRARHRLADGLSDWRPS